MADLPQVRPDRLVRALQRAGFRIERTSGSHVILERGDGRFANVPMHAGLTADELRNFL
jgi:predicted RNA binding protein YcfA (HicA-like mRNA interferase family)